MDQKPKQNMNQKPKPKRRKHEAKHQREMSHGFYDLFLPKKGKRLRMNHYIFYSCFLMVLVFLGMMGYMIRFMIVDSQNVITNPYNKRTETLGEQVVRGSILSADGEILAHNIIDEDGEDRREYPFGRQFAHVIGYASHGKGGLESSYNYELMTSHANIMTQIENGMSSKKNPGDNLTTTLDTHLQETAYDALDDYRGAVVAIEPSTGKIRAMVSKPDFNPNNLDEIWTEIVEDDSSTVLLNRATQGLYPPGSTYKVITALEYLIEHPHTYQDFTYDCEGETIVDSVRIHCYENTEHGEEDLEKAFRKSCNTAFVSIGSKLHRKDYMKLNELLLFNHNISCDLPVKKSQFTITEKTDDSQLPQTVIGQGDTLMSPLHNALVMCCIANGGEMMQPMLAEKIEGADGYGVKTFSPKTLLKLDHANEIAGIQKMLRKTVTDGTGYALDTEDYTVAGKTGSAENEKERAHSWFVGYSNIEDPDLVVCVIVENTGAGSKYAAPIAREVFDAYYGCD